MQYLRERLQELVPRNQDREDDTTPGYVISRVGDYLDGEVVVKYSGSDKVDRLTSEDTGTWVDTALSESEQTLIRFPDERDDAWQFLRENAVAREFIDRECGVSGESRGMVLERFAGEKVRVDRHLQTRRNSSSQGDIE